MYGTGSFHGSPYPTTPYMDDHPNYSDDPAVSIISTSTRPDHTSTHPDHTSMGGSSHPDSTSQEDSTHPTAPAGQEQGEEKFHFNMEALAAKTEQLSMDSAYTSEADLDSSQNTTAPNSGTTSPKQPCNDITAENSAPSSPKQNHVGYQGDGKIPETSQILLSPSTGEGMAT